MNSFNRGEWSEFYGVLFLLIKPRVQLVDGSLKPVDKFIYLIKEIILDSKLKLKYKIDENNNNILVYADSKFLNSFSKDEIEEEKNKLLDAIIHHTDKKGAFSIPQVETFVTEMTGGVSFKSKSGSKSDVITISLDILQDKESKLSYSIKSSLGSPATILNASSNTDFKYKIVNFPISEIKNINSIETRTKLLDRINKIKNYNGTKIVFDSVVSKEFDYNLKMIDSLLPNYLGNALLYSYEYNNKNLKEIFHLANPDLDENFANKKLGDFLNGISFGFVPGKKWDGINTVNGGLVLVKSDGDVVVLDLIYYPQEVARYIINESKLDSPSTHRYHMLDLFEENGEVYFTLNLQVRYKS